MNAQQLRAAILQQAIEGKLVPQLDSEPAVEQIGEAPEDVPFAIPEKWKWVELKQLANPTRQKIPDKEFTYIDVGSISNFQITSPKKIRAIDAPSRARKVVTEGMILYSTVRPYLMNVCIASDIKGETIASTAFAAFMCDETLIEKYIFAVLVGPYFTGYVKRVQKGVSYPAINDKDFYSAWIPLPPLSEQRRIVAKLEELLPLVEEYGKSQDALDKMNAEIGDKLRASILQEAIQGKLVPQLDEEPAVEQIGEAPEDVPFAIPEKWKWVKFSDVCVNFSPHDYQIKTSEVMKEGEYPVVSQSQKLIDGYCDDKTKLVPKDKLPFIVFGDHTRVVKYINFQCIIGADGTKLIHSAFYDLKYLFYAIMAVVPSTKDRGYSRHYQFLKKSLIPLPPLEEQRRIVAKIEELLQEVEKISR